VNAGLRAGGGGGQAAFERLAGAIERRDVLGDHELEVGEEQDGPDLERDLRGVLRRVDRPVGLGLPGAARCPTVRTIPQATARPVVLPTPEGVR
jgi:hypothetical protein